MSNLIYLSGGMSGLSEEDMKKWRIESVNTIKNICCKNFICPPDFFDPTVNYPITTFDEDLSNYLYEKSAMNYDLYWLRKSNYVLVNFNNPDSLGTAMELILAKELGLPIIGINEGCKYLHPWVFNCCDEIFDNLNDACEHLFNYYLKHNK